MYEFFKKMREKNRTLQRNFLALQVITVYCVSWGSFGKKHVFEKTYLFFAL